jgi:hypothetical protein
MVCDPEQDYWRVSPQSFIWQKVFCKGVALIKRASNTDLNTNGSALAKQVQMIAGG